MAADAHVDPLLLGVAPGKAPAAPGKARLSTLHSPLRLAQSLDTEAPPLQVDSKQGCFQL